ncbi:MAG: hypothetical protein FWE20_12250 [Defluviitaleaceae bacterium]|nr:hypothetical protein [Defluviitaleaceae bacterium]
MSDNANEQKNQHEIPENFMKGTFPLQKRKYGEEQPGIRMGIFTIRLPLIHHRWMWTEFLAALFLGVACLGAGVAITMTQFGLEEPGNLAALGITAEQAFLIALSFGILNAICYYIPALMGDPVVPGWITPSLPLTIAFLSQFAVPDFATGEVTRIQAMIALQLTVAVIFLIMGIGGIGRAIVRAVPDSIKAGIVLGAGVAAGINVINARVPFAPYTVIIAIIISYFFLFNPKFAEVCSKSKVWSVIRSQGIVPAQVFAIVLAPALLREIPMPEIQWGITPVSFGFVMQNFTVFGLGWPAVELFLMALPLALACYIIAFSDIVLVKELVNDATTDRPDEKVDFNPTRTNLVSAMRNGIMALFAPYVPMCGPVWASGLLTVTERYKRGYKTMSSYWDGVGTFRAATIIAVMILPMVTLVRPAFHIFFGITMAVQAFACGNIGMRMAKTNNDRGIACCIAAAMAVVSPQWALLIGVGVWLVVQGPDFLYKKKDDKAV